MLTEEEAKTKWCPAVRVTAENDRCIGSACMAWRAVEDEWSRKAADAEYIKSGRRLPVTTKGYCGLAGRPA